MKHGDIGDVVDGQVKPALDRPGDGKFITSTFGPKAVFKSGQLGNFEPVILPKTGAGKRHTHGHKLSSCLNGVH